MADPTPAASFIERAELSPPLVGPSTLLLDSLDLGATLRSVAGLIVPALADYCVIDLLEGEPFDPIGAAFASASSRALIRRATDRKSPTMSRVIESGRAMLHADVAGELGVTDDEDPYLPELRAAGVGSFMVVPLNARDRALGTIALLMVDSGRRFGQGDLALVEELAGRAALAMDNARLYQAEQRERQRAERAADRTARLQRVTAALAQAITPAEVAALVIDEGVAAVGAKSGASWLLDGGDRNLYMVRAVGFAPGTASRYERVPVDDPTPLGDAVRSGEPVWLGSLELLARCPAVEEVQPARDRECAVACLPLRLGSHSTGGLVFVFGDRRRLDEDERNFLTLLARQCAQSLDRARLFDAERSARARVERELAERRNAERRLAMQLQIASTLAAASNAAEAAPKVLAIVGQSIDSDYCELWRIDPDAHQLKLTGAWRSPGCDASALEAAGRRASFLRGMGLPGRVWAVAAPICVIDIQVDAEFPRKREAALAGLRGAYALPIRVDGEVVGVLALYGRDAKPPALEWSEALEAVGSQIGQFLSRERAESESDRQARRIAMLTEALCAFAAAGVELQPALDTVAHELAARLGDACVIRRLVGDRLVTVAVHHADPDRLELLRAFSGAAIAAPYGPLEQVMLEGRALLVPQVSDEPADTALPLDPTPRLAPTSMLSVPLRAGERIDGCITLYREQLELSYTADDQRLLEDLCDRAGLAIENARLYQQARAAVRARDDFLSIASHELKTPLSALLLGVQSLSQLADPPDERLERRVRIATHQVLRLAGLVDKLLDVSRIEAGGIAVELEPVDLAALVAEGVERLADEIERAGCPVQLLAPAPVRGNWDRMRLEQVVSNLVMNAIKYGGGKPVSITVEGSDGEACLTVRDQGIGIAAADQARVFERFERAVSGSTYGGFGLGLWISRQVVEALGGRISVASAPGEGATFTVVLPR